LPADPASPGRPPGSNRPGSNTPEGSTSAAPQPPGASQATGSHAIRGWATTRRSRAIIPAILSNGCHPAHATDQHIRPVSGTHQAVATAYPGKSVPV